MGGEFALRNSCREEGTGTGLNCELHVGYRSGDASYPLVTLTHTHLGRCITSSSLPG